MSLCICMCLNGSVCACVYVGVGVERKKVHACGMVWKCVCVCERIQTGVESEVKGTWF